MANAKKIHEVLTKNLLYPIILGMLDDHPMCGYEIMLTIKKAYGVNLGPSKMYPTLTNLENNNLVTNDWNMDDCHPKKIYRLTEEGKNQLHYTIRALSRICKSLDKKTDDMQLGLII